MKAFAVMLALLIPAQAWPQSALEQAGMLGRGPAPADGVYDGSRFRSDPSDGAVAAGSGSGTKALPAMTEGVEKKSEEIVPNPFAPPTPQPGDPRAKRGAVKGGIIGGIFGLIAGLVGGWAIGVSIGGPVAIGIAIVIGALALGAAGGAIGADVGKHCAVDPECG